MMDVKEREELATVVAWGTIEHGEVHGITLVQEALEQIDAEYAKQVVDLNAVIGSHEVKMDEAMHVITELLALVDDFMPNVGHCTLQNYQRLNDAPIEARRVLDRLESR